MTLDSASIGAAAETLLRAIRTPVDSSTQRTRAATAAKRAASGVSGAKGMKAVSAGAARGAEDFARWMARAAGLRYVTDASPGWTRRRSGKRFAYFDADGRRIRDAQQVKRVDSLAIPPAYRDVWICPDPKGHIQATARDDRGRKQYRYHAKWQEVSATIKFERMIAFGDRLSRIRRIVSRQLRQPGMSRDKVLAAVVQLLDLTLIRVGNDEYAKQNRSYGLTTLQTRHVQVNGTKMTFGFRGKSGIEHRISLQHKALAAFIRSCLEMPGRELFQYVDDNGRRRAVTSVDVNAYLQSIGDPSISAKDFRTWGASAMALGDLRERTFSSTTEGKRATREMFKAVAERLGNTAAVCRKSYIHPHVVDCFLGERLATIEVIPKRGLNAHEAAFLSLLKAAEHSEKAQGPRNRSRVTLH